jgi:EmrB/QacA subfamily drug resistance transporter
MDESTPTRREEPVYRTASEPKLKFLVPLVVACAMVMESLDQTIITTSIPQMAQSLGESPLRLNVAITSYLLSLAVFIPVSGWIADRYGARSVFCVAMAVFTVGSALCGAANSLTTLVLMRILQGLGGALMTPVGRLVLLKSFPKSELVTAMSYVAIPALVGPAIGPLLGGFLTSYVSWRWIFYVNVPFGALGILLALRYFENFRGSATGRFDFFGFILCGIGLAAVEVGLEVTGRRLISGWAEGSIWALSALSLAAYGFYARRTPNPAVDLKIFRIKTFRLGVLAGSICRVGLSSTSFLVPLLLQIPFGFSAFKSGLVTSVLAIGAISMRLVSPPLLRRLGFRNILLGNGTITSAMMLALALITYGAPVAWILCGLFALGFFRSLQFTCMNTLGYSDLVGHEISPGSSLSSVAQQLSMSFGVTISATMLALITAPNPLPSAADFRPVLVCMAVFPLVSSVWFMRLHPEDGVQVTGYRLRKKV